MREMDRHVYGSETSQKRKNASDKSHTMFSGARTIFRHLLHAILVLVMLGSQWLEEHQ